MKRGWPLLLLLSWVLSVFRWDASMERLLGESHLAVVCACCDFSMAAREGRQIRQISSTTPDGQTYAGPDPNSDL